MRVSDILINKLKSYESLRLQSYKCPAGVWTIGWGHTKGVKQGQTISVEQAEQLLKGDILPCEKYVNKISSMFTQGQFDALVDFAFNCGINALANSTLLSKVKQGDVAAVQREFKRWNKSKGVVLPGLVKRREWEAQRYAE